MHTITVVPLGPGSPDLLTLGTLRQLKKARQVVLRTRRHGAAKRLADEGLNFDSLDTLYEQSGDFDQFARTAAQTIIDRAQDAAVTYAVADPASDATVALLKQRAGDSLRILPGVSLHAPLIAAALPGAQFEQGPPGGDESHLGQGKEAVQQHQQQQREAMPGQVHASSGTGEGDR